MESAPADEILGWYPDFVCAPVGPHRSLNLPLGIAAESCSCDCPELDPDAHRPIRLGMMITTLFGSEEPKKPAGSEEEPERKSGFFDRMKQAVSRTRETFSAKIADIAALTRTVDESALEELETALLSSDLGVETTTAILDALRDRARHKAIEGGAEL